MNRFFLAVLLAGCLSVSGCGFHLRGLESTRARLESIDFVSADVHGAINRELLKRFRDSGTEVSASAPLKLSVSGERRSRRAVATTRTNSVAEYELRLEVEMALTDRSGRQIVPGTTIATERIYTFDNTSLTGSSEEEELLFDEMRKDIAAQILRRVNASIRPAGPHD